MKSLLLVSIVGFAGSTAKLLHLARDDYATQLYARHAYSDKSYLGQFLRRSDLSQSHLSRLSRRGNELGKQSGSDSDSESAVEYPRLKLPNSPWAELPEREQAPAGSPGASPKKGEGWPSKSGIEYYPGGFSAIPINVLDPKKVLKAKGARISRADPLPDLSKPLPGPTAEHGKFPGESSRSHGGVPKPQGSGGRRQAATGEPRSLMQSPSGGTGGRRQAATGEPGSLMKTPGTSPGASPGTSPGGSPKAQSAAAGRSILSKFRKGGK